jgi:hypothetical protein
MHAPNRPVVFNASWLAQHLADPENVPFPTLPADHEQRDWVVPLHWGNHWTLGYYNRTTNEFAHLDSLGEPGDARDELAVQRLNYMLGRIYPSRRPTRNSTIRSARQANGYDCGMHVIENARDLAGGRMPGREIDGMQARAQLAQRIMNTAMRIERENDPALAGAEALTRLAGPAQGLPFRYPQDVPGMATDQWKDVPRTSGPGTAVSSPMSKLTSLGAAPSPPASPRGRPRSRLVSASPPPDLGRLRSTFVMPNTPPPTQPPSQLGVMRCSQTPPPGSTRQGSPVVRETPQQSPK